jgi:hypothetical protein
MYLGLTAEVKIQIFNGFHLPIRMHFAHAEFIYALVDTKGELISKCPFGVFKSPKKTGIFFPGFLP